MTDLVLILGVLGGFVAGVLWREAWELIQGRDDEMALWHRVKMTPQTALVVGLIVSMVFTGLVGVYVAVSNNDRGDLIDCIGEYNTQVGDARDSRTEVANSLAAAELRYLDAELTYQRGLLDSLDDPVPGTRLRDTIETRIDATEDYRRQVRNQENVRDAKPYPSPTLCEDPQ